MSAFCASGSSPRVRGKLAAGSEIVLSVRIIPARAGQTWRTGPRCRRWPDHPRACGANDNNRKPIARLFGSSPRVRGKPIRHHVACDRRRIIPARAGQTRPVPGRAGLDPDHPRACGANGEPCFGFGDEVGSSPRVRGKHIHRQTKALAIRIIPARAGQTTRASRRRPSATDHPRACGANDS